MKASKLFLLFNYPSNYTTTTITSFAGKSFSYIYDVRIQEKPTYSIVVFNYANNAIVQFNQSKAYVRFVTCPYQLLHGEAVDNGNIYAGVWHATNRIQVFTSTLGVVAQPLIATTSYMYAQYIMRYNSFTGLLYQCDSSTGYLNAFSTGYAQVLANTIRIANWGYTPISVDFYTTAAGVNLVYVSTFSNLVIVYKSGAVQGAYINPICVSTYAWSLTIDNVSGYFVAACYADNTIRLWLTNGTTHTYTGKTIGITNPTGADYDAWGRLVVSGVSGTLTIFSPWDYPYK